MPESDSVSQKWPKVLPQLSPEQQKINDDFMKLWHEVLPQKFGIVEKFNHLYPVRYSRPGFKTTLEIGAGLGEHLNYEELNEEQVANYYANEFRPNMEEKIREAHPNVQTVLGDCQERLDFPDGFFDRYLAIHVLEHLPNLPACIREAYRLLNRENGQLLVVIPCEGGLAYTAGRRVSAQRIFEKTYKISYDTFIKREHINLPNEILEELDPYFTIDQKRFFPFPFFPVVTANLCIGLSLSPRPNPLS